VPIQNFLEPLFLNLVEAAAVAESVCAVPDSTAPDIRNRTNTMLSSWLRFINSILAGVKTVIPKINIIVFIETYCRQKSKTDDRIFIEINLLMETFIVNVDELLLNLPLFNYA